ncbi:hypothetical protein TRV_04204 [Trichophyton verrucosum HKI 0517]|uniref:Protein kinase domain-containing protein n=1 Tax=Trichophyton verrucosum (strain HKI 0517) TaxID=663202 RepID=D4DAQ6_TRIVH|nr:uncharacterized protein TRV_04204 [Trichophyton verrucosum HKI 0517]EFE41075.1 hypothetical protein TRV_04204 [Trichophyton verrucosum HKI 0517]
MSDVGAKALSGEWERISNRLLEMKEDMIMSFEGRPCNIVDTENNLVEHLKVSKSEEVEKVESFFNPHPDSTLSGRIQRNQVCDESTEVVTKMEKLEPIAFTKEMDESAGNLGPRTEQSALGSLYYLINYGFELYGDRCIDPDNPREHGFKMASLLQSMIFPELKGDPFIDDIIHKCWHNKYRKVADLAEHTEALLVKESSAAKDTEAGSSEDVTWKKVLCQDLENCGLLEFLCSDEPVKLCFPLGWYIYSETADGPSEVEVWFTFRFL